MNILSLFDGLGGARIALDRLGITPKRYFSSEIDKYAHGVAKCNYPDIISLGDVTKIDGTKLGQIDLLIGGSPCQNFSYAGKQKGMTTTENIEITTLNQYLELKRNDFEFEGQSYLFWEWVRLFEEIKPKYFLLENVKMIKKWSDIITKTLMVDPILINSALLSAQNRKRYYWTNIPVRQPEDKGILLKDILESGFTEREKSLCVRASGNSPADTAKKRYVTKHFGQFKWKTPNIPKKKEMLDNLDLMEILTITEYEKLQTLKPNYTKIMKQDGVIRQTSTNQRYKMIGNGFTVDVITHILRGIKDDPKNTN